jgi:hypothetical protein
VEQGQQVELRNALFCVEGDNVYFRGLDAGREWEGYACPLFNFWNAKTAARYISNGSVGISFNKEQNAFTMSRHGDARQYLLRMYKIGKEIYVDFGGTAKWKKLEEQPKKEGPT